MPNVTYTLYGVFAYMTVNGVLTALLWKYDLQFNTAEVQKLPMHTLKQV